MGLKDYTLERMFGIAGMVSWLDLSFSTLRPSFCRGHFTWPPMGAHISIMTSAILVILGAIWPLQRPPARLSLSSLGSTRKILANRGVDGSWGAFCDEIWLFPNQKLILICTRGTLNQR